MKNINRFFAIVLFIVFSVSAWGASVTIASWNGASRTANQTYAPTSSQTDNSGARLKSECGLTSAGSGGCDGAYYGDWTNGNSIYITGLNLSGYSDISLDISLRRRYATCTASFYVSTNGSSYSSSALDTETLTNTCTNYTVSSIGSNVQAIKITMTGGSGNLWLGSVTISGTAASTCTNTPTMSFTNTSVDKTTDDASYTQTVNISGKGAGQTVAYTSSDETIGTVNTSGVVTLKGKVGSTTITASVEASGTYCSASASYTINVTKAPINVTLYYKGTSTTLNNQPNPYALPTTDTYAANACDAWTFDGWYGSAYAKSTTKPTYITELTASGNAYAVYKHTEGGGEESFTPTNTSANGWTSSRGSQSATIGNFTVSTDDGICSSEIRTYSGSNFTVSTSIGKITSISFTPSSGYYISNLSTTKGSISGNVWTGNESSITFSASAQVRFNEIIVSSGNVYYSTDAECGPKVQATASPWVTSTNGQFVKVEVPVTATNFDKNSTLSASVSGAGFSIVGWGANGNVVTKDEDLTTSLILEYNPTAYNTTADATITFSSNYSGSQTPVYTAGTVHGRSLPEKFVIAIKNGDQWYALPANMSGSGTYAGEAVSVDDINNPTKVTAGPATALYSLLNVYKTSGANDRYAEYGTRVRFLGNEKCLWSNAANGGTGINNGAAPASATSDNYEWSLVTTDGITYAINTNVAQKQTEGRNLYYRDGESRFGMYTSGNNSFRFLPVDCDNRATVTATATTYNSITLTWAGKSGTSYNVYIDEGGVTKKTETGVTSPVTISGLSSETNYTWIISPGDKDNDCALSGNFTTNVAPINVTLSCDGTEYHLGPQDNPYTLPTTGVYVNNACTEWTFEGWTTNTHSKSTSKPTLIDQVSTDGTVYAVYKHTDGGGSTAYTLTIQPSDFASEGYPGTLNDIDAVDDSDNTNTMSVSFNKSNAGKVGSVIQFKNNGYIYNTTDLGTISSISTNNSNVGYYINSAQNPSSAGSGGYFKLYGVSSTATSNTTSSIDIHFTKSNSTTYYATSSECCNEVAPPTVAVEPIDVSATISWDNQVGATNGYHVTCSNGTDQDVAAGVTSLVISGLSASTSYDYTVTAKGATCNRTFEGSFTTASCSDVPTDVAVSVGTHTATIRWTASASTATIVIYDDDLGSNIVTSVPGQTSPCTISGLNDNTDYYLQVFAGGGCPHPIKPFRTQATAVSIAEWFPDSIRINLAVDEATATVIIEDKQENSTVTTSYADGLFFSKYYEAYKNIKLWAIYNGTAEKISLANIKVKSSNNSSDWGKSNGLVDNQKITALDTMGHHEKGYIYPGEEIIVYNNGNDADDASIITCMESTYGLTYKNDPDSVWYLVKNLTTSLSGDDGLLLLNGTDTLDVIGGINAGTAYSAANSQPSWGDADGWNCDDGEDAEGNTLALSTNRCLLVRKNTVKSGLNAVAQNRDYFNTLCDEWWGAQVPDEDNATIEVQTSCDNFSYVGHYDYNSYYAHFDSITTVDELTGKKNDDGTYTIPIPQLDTLSCTMLRVKVYEGTEEKASTEYKVPIMIKTTDATTADDAYFHSYARETNSADVCRECDVVILKGATLTKASSDETKDINEVRNLTIYPGGTLIIPSGAKYEYTVNSLTMRVEGENVPFAKLKGTLNSATQQVIVTRRQDNSRPYFFSLPYDCNVSDIRWSNGETPVLGTDYRIMTYDGATRAAQGSANNGRFWTYLTETDVIHAGVGYNIQTPYQYLHELVFPMTLATTDVTAEEDDKAVITAIHQYTNSGTSINNHNWNLIAHPYISPFNPQEDGDIRYGWLDYHYDEGDNVIWERKDETHVYLTMPSFGASKVTYDQKLHSAAGVLNPFLAIFVQGAGEGDITFDKTNRILTAAPPRHLAAEAEHADESLFVGVTLTTNGKSDQTNVRLRPDFTNEYKLGYDLDKFITYYTERPQVYMVNGSRMAFRAVSDEVAANTAMPMGVYGEYAGTYTFALSEDYPIDYVEAVYLTDRETGQTTNLLYGTYSFQTSGRIYTESRFTLSVVVRREAPQTPTDIETVVSGAQQTRKILYNGLLYILQGGRVYDATGKQMLNR